MRRATIAAGAALLGLLLLIGVAAAEAYQRGPARMIDADTVVLANGQHVRVALLDTPERRHRARCPRERELAEQATARGAELLASGFTVTDSRGRDKYGRRLASIALPDGRDYAAVLIAEGLGARYTGRGPKPTWCAPGR